jgi:hypothetical protein
MVSRGVCFIAPTAGRAGDLVKQQEQGSGTLVNLVAGRGSWFVQQQRQEQQLRRVSEEVFQCGCNLEEGGEVVRVG